MSEDVDGGILIRERGRRRQVVVFSSSLSRYLFFSLEPVGSVINEQHVVFKDAHQRHLLDRSGPRQETKGRSAR